VAQAAVGSFSWLAPGEMLDGLGLAETTPGPLIMVLQFVGFLAAYRAPGALDPLLAGCLGALLTTWVTFAPCFLWIFAGAPYIEALRGNTAISSALSAITAAVVGVIMNLALWFALHVVFREVRTFDVLGAGPDLPVLSSIDWRAAVLSLADDCDAALQGRHDSNSGRLRNRWLGPPLVMSMIGRSEMHCRSSTYPRRDSI
jgi:chromate transporter